MKRTGFTLIELLVVIAIIAILAAILFPVFAQARAQARKITCVSNMKQIALGVMMYTQDYDEKPPIKRTVTDGSQWWNGKMMNWKDGVIPYIKNGGRAYNNGQNYMTPGSGGVFQCPENSAAWSAQTNVYWGGWGPGEPGDETTRYPRSYAINMHAGNNEQGSTNGQFWPSVEGLNNINTGGTLATLSTPASTIMLCETRMFMVDMWSNAMGYQCTADGIPAGGTPTGCIQGHHGGLTNFAFFDGHVKTTRLQQSVQSDMWDAFAPNTDWSTNGSYLGPQAQKDILNSINGIQEWTTGI